MERRVFGAGFRFGHRFHGALSLEEIPSSDVLPTAVQAREICLFVDVGARRRGEFPGRVHGGQQQRQPDAPRV